MVKNLNFVVLALILVVSFGCETLVKRSSLGSYEKVLSWGESEKLYYSNYNFVYVERGKSHTFDGVSRVYDAELIGSRQGENLTVSEVRVFYRDKSKSFKVNRPVLSFGNTKENGYGDKIKTGGMHYMSAGYLDDLLADVGRYRKLLAGSYEHSSGAKIVLDENGEGVSGSEKILLSNQFGRSDLVLTNGQRNLPVLSFDEGGMVLGNEKHKIVFKKINVKK
jgi:hypothetical protein